MLKVPVMDELVEDVITVEVVLENMTLEEMEEKEVVLVMLCWSRSQYSCCRW